MVGNPENMGDMSGMMDMMSKMMDNEGNRGMPMMQDMMSKMMPQGITMVLSKLSKEQRTEFAETMITTLMEQASEGLSKEEKSNFIEKVIKRIKPDMKK